jgi:hypothetical protein
MVININDVELFCFKTKSIYDSFVNKRWPCTSLVQGRLVGCVQGPTNCSFATAAYQESRLQRCGAVEIVNHGFALYTMGLQPAARQVV